MFQFFNKTNQEWFNGAWERSKAKVKSVNDEGRCVYRDANTSGCFIGCQVPAKVKLKELCAASSQPVKVSNLSIKQGKEFLIQLQDIHDTVEPNDWEEELINFAEEWDLDIPESYSSDSSNAESNTNTYRSHRNDKGQFHKEDGPAVEYHNSKAWYLNGKLHREDGPAIEDGNGYRLWYYNGKLHRLGGPAVYGNNVEAYAIMGQIYERKEYYMLTDKSKLDLIDRFLYWVGL